MQGNERNFCGNEKLILVRVCAAWAMRKLKLLIVWNSLMKRCGTYPLSRRMFWALM